MSFYSILFYNFCTRSLDYLERESPFRKVKCCNNSRVTVGKYTFKINNENTGTKFKENVLLPLLFSLNRYLTNLANIYLS